jgi:hypothetical protein
MEVAAEVVTPAPERMEVARTEAMEVTARRAPSQEHRLPTVVEAVEIIAVVARTEQAVPEEVRQET